MSKKVSKVNRVKPKSVNIPGRDFFCQRRKPKVKKLVSMAATTAAATVQQFSIQLERCQAAFI